MLAKHSHPSHVHADAFLLELHISGNFFEALIGSAFVTKLCAEYGHQD